MFVTRLIVGVLLAALMFGVLIGDEYLPPWFPFLFGLCVLLGLAGTRELVDLFPLSRRPSLPICIFAVLGVIVANWTRPLHEAYPALVTWSDPWHAILGVFVAALLTAFLRELARYDAPGEAITRIALTAFVIAYLGVLASFLIQLRWPADRNNHAWWVRLAMLLAVFVPKCCDIGAYCTGRLFGHTKMTPKLSPNKTWEGAAGGLTLAAVTALGGGALGGRPDWWWLKAIAFGIVIGGIGMLGDLAESLIKRECQRKDASQSVPGFGGVLDVIDSVIFAAPLAYVWLNAGSISPL